MCESGHGFGLEIIRKSKIKKKNLIKKKQKHEND